MTMLLGLLAILFATLLTFSDRIVEYLSPTGDLASRSDEVDKVIEILEGQDDFLHEAT